MSAREKAPVTARRKAGLQDDHDPSDIGQEQNNREEERGRAKSSEGKLDDDNLPDDDSKFG